MAKKKKAKKPRKTGRASVKPKPVKKALEIQEGKVRHARVKVTWEKRLKRTPRRRKAEVDKAAKHTVSESTLEGKLMGLIKILDTVDFDRERERLIDTLRCFYGARITGMKSHSMTGANVKISDAMPPSQLHNDKI